MIIEVLFYSCAVFAALFSALFTALFAWSRGDCAEYSIHVMEEQPCSSAGLERKKGGSKRKHDGGGSESKKQK